MYKADSIEVLEGLAPVRKRPGMYIGGTDVNAYHHLASEIIDNSIDEAISGYCTSILVHLIDKHTLLVGDDGRGIPIDSHPKFPEMSALEVILTMLHSGGKFSDDNYKTSGGLHGVGLSVVNALSSKLKVTVKRDGLQYEQEYSRGVQSEKVITNIERGRGTTIVFTPDNEIFGDECEFIPERIYNLLKMKSYAFKNIKIQWKCNLDFTPKSEIIKSTKGLEDWLDENIEFNNELNDESRMTFCGEEDGVLNWAIAIPSVSKKISFCNLIPTTNGGSHETGFKSGITRSFRSFSDLVGIKKVPFQQDDIFDDCTFAISFFINEPIFQGQTKEKLVSPEASRICDNLIKEKMDKWLIKNKDIGISILGYVYQKAEDRNKKKTTKETKTYKRIRLPGKLTECSSDVYEDREIFLVEGDSAGGTAKQARDRKTQAILPLRGKILNVAQATKEKINANQEIQALRIAIGDNRYSKVIIMTDADVDGAHIASLLLTFFYHEMRSVFDTGLYIACPPLYRITSGDNVYYAKDDKEKDKIITKKGKFLVNRFKGLGEMSPQHLKETTMSKDTRKLVKVDLDTESGEFIVKLMGKSNEFRWNFIQEMSSFCPTS
jgi:topoisomerase IV subunit B